MYKDKLIVALDYPNVDDAKKLVTQLGNSVNFYKIGMELIASRYCYKLSDYLINQGKRIFFDPKLYDIPRTVSAAVKQFNKLGASFITVHGDDDIIKAAVNADGVAQILAVTVLTSLDQEGLKQLGIYTNIKNLVLYRAKRACELGCDGVVSSGLEVNDIRKVVGQIPTLVVPGIRKSNLGSVGRKCGKSSLMMIPEVLEKIINYDQKRTATVRQVFESGANYIVIGRQITNAMDPKAEVESIQKEIALALDKDG